MSEFACDRCGRGLLTDADVRYVVKIELVAAFDPMEITPGDLARDHQGEIEQVLAQLADMDEEEINSSVYKTMIFDLCATCRRPFLDDPLGRQDRSSSARVPDPLQHEGHESKSEESNRRTSDPEMRP